MSKNAPERLAAALLAIEGLVLLIVAGWEITALVGGDSDDAGTSIALIVLTIIGAAAVLAFAVATGRGASWGRSGGIVTQLLMLAVALGAVTGPAPAPGFAAIVAVPAVLGLALLFLAARRAGARRRDAEPHEGAAAPH